MYKVRKGRGLWEDKKEQKKKKEDKRKEEKKWGNKWQALELNGKRNKKGKQEQWK